jgi:hypothetical protein
MMRIRNGSGVKGEVWIRTRAGNNTPQEKKKKEINGDASPYLLNINPDPGFVVNPDPDLGFLLTKM